MAAAAAGMLVALFFVLPSDRLTGQETQVGPPARELAPPVGAGPVESASPRGAAGADASPAASELPDPRSLAPTADKEPGRLVKAAQRLNVWEDDFGAVRAEVVATVRNTGGSPVRVVLSEATWAVADAAGDVVAQGRFAHAFPPVVEAGGVAYLIDGVSATFADPEELARLDIELRGEAVDGDRETIDLDVEDVVWSAAQGGGVVVSGRIKNPSAAAVDETHVAVVLTNDQDEVLAAVYDVAIGPLEPGESRRFDTAYPATPPIDPNDVKVVEAIATGIGTRTAVTP